MTSRTLSALAAALLGCAALTAVFMMRPAVAASSCSAADGWDGTWSQSGSTVTIMNASWNGSLPAGGSTTIGANFSYSGSDTAPATITCTGNGGPAPTTSPTPSPSPAGGARLALARRTSTPPWPRR